MNEEELIQRAIAHGASIGQTSLANFIIRDYGHNLSPELTLFLNKLSQKCYEDLSKDLERPAEDVALEVEEIMKVNV